MFSGSLVNKNKNYNKFCLFICKSSNKKESKVHIISSNCCRFNVNLIYLIMATITQTKTKVKDKQKDISQVVNSGENLDDIIKDLKKIDDACAFSKCKKKTIDFSITCKYCNCRFCTTHGLPEIHGCGEAVRRDEKQKFLHPPPKLSQEKHAKAADKLASKLKQMQSERKAKQCSSKTKK